MGGKAVVDVDLTIEANGDRTYRAVLANASSAVDRTTTFRLAPGRDSWDTALLAEAVFSGAVGEAWRAATAAAEAAGRRVRLRLHEAPTDVPWELLTAGRPETTTMRLVAAKPRPPLRISGPIRVLVLCRPDDEVAAELRWVALQNAVEQLVAAGALAVERLHDCSPTALAGVLRAREVHILHVVNGDPADPSLEAVVADHPSLRLVLLDRDGPPGWAGSGTTAQAVQLAGRAGPAVAATSVPTSAAGKYFWSFYLALVSEAPFDIAASCLAAPVVAVAPPAAGLFDGILTTTAHSPDTTYTGTVGAVPPLPPPSTVPPPSQAYQRPPPPSSQPSPAPPPRSARGGSFWRAVRDAAADLFSRDRPSPAPGPSTPADRTAYPRIEVRAGRHRRPDVVVVEEPFDVVVGLGPYQDTALTQTAGLRFAAATPRVELELVLTFDPTSLHTAGPTRLTLAVTDDDPHPSARLHFTARYRPDLPSVRRIGVQYMRDGQVVAVAWRRFAVVLHRDDVTAAVPPSPEPNSLLDLGPLLGADLPDLVLSICASDGAASGEFVWTAYARSPEVVVPDAPRISLLENDLREFMSAMQADAASPTDGYAAYLSLVGKATKVGRAVPPGITSVVRAVVEDPGRRQAATVLLLTEELSLPWELAVLDPPLQTDWGGVSPFLGAHAAIARWPLTQHRPRPTPRSSVRVRRAAVLAADYTGVPGWNRLDHALMEAREVAALFSPPAVTVRPHLPDVVGVLRGVPPADLLHVALHGQFDAAGSQEGLVLLAADAGPVRSALFLTPDQVENGRLDGGPFVFLNACQVGADKRVLADYAGFASTLLRIGAAGVVAPLWNVDDDVAAAFAQDFYAATWSTLDGATVAEAVRAQRARYTEAAAAAHTPGVTPTLIAFQVFGHPRLRLTHV